MCVCVCCYIARWRGGAGLSPLDLRTGKLKDCVACNRAALVALLDGFARNGTVVDTSPTTPFYAKAEAYVAEIAEAVERARGVAGTIDQRVDACVDFVFVQAGLEILKIVPGRVSTEVPARLSFDYGKTLEKARQLIKLYEDAGESRDRVLIKVASTWEGIQAAKELEAEGIECNITLVFGFLQAAAAAQAKAIGLN